MKRYKYLEGFQFASCHVRARNIVGFAAQKWTNNDPLEQRETAVFFYYPDQPEKDRWAYVGIGEATGIHGCAVFAPDERWVFVMDDGLVYVAGHGQNGFEKPISEEGVLYFSNVKSVKSGHALAVGPRRKVFIRKGRGRWVRLDAGLYPKGEDTDLEHAGFSDIDGFSENDIYACGGTADLWHYDGKLWVPVDLPTNSVLERICCADDGFVYITTNVRDVVRGLGSVWEIISSGKPDETLESIISYNGMILASTISEIYQVDVNGFRVAELSIPKMRSKAHLAEGDGILIIAGSDEAVMYDGVRWSTILKPV